jgi:hypothetical protein
MEEKIASILQELETYIEKLEKENQELKRKLKTSHKIEVLERIKIKQETRKLLLAEIKSIVEKSPYLTINKLLYEIGTVAKNYGLSF